MSVQGISVRGVDGFCPGGGVSVQGISVWGCLDLDTPPPAATTMISMHPTGIHCYIGLILKMLSYSSNVLTEKSFFLFSCFHLIIIMFSSIEPCFSNEE